MSLLLLALLVGGFIVWRVQLNGHKQDLINAYREGQRDRYGIPLRFKRTPEEQAELERLEAQWNSRN